MTSNVRYHLPQQPELQNVNTGVIMQMLRIDHKGTVSFKRKINTQCNKDGKATDLTAPQRHRHPACETPEGQSRPDRKPRAAGPRLHGHRLRDGFETLMVSGFLRPTHRHQPHAPVARRARGRAAQRHRGGVDAAPRELIRWVRTMRRSYHVPFDTTVVWTANAGAC